MKVAVVGGGLAGLAAAIECADAGASVTLYEARSRLGGATFSFERNGLWLDNGQHVALRCCTAYLGFLRRIGSAHLLPLQRRLHVPVLREGQRPALLSRTALPPPLHLASTLLRYAPLGLRERLAAARAARALGKLDSDDPALDEQTFGWWLANHGQSEKAISALWNLIALPTLNLPAGEASLAAAVKVFRTGLFDSAGASDIGIPAVPFQRLHADPAAATLERAGGRLLLGTPVRALSELDDDAIILAVPHEAVAALALDAVNGEALEALGTSPIVNLHIHYDRRVLDGPLAAALDSPVQWLFDRTEAAGASDGQLVAVSLSHAVEEIGVPVAELSARYLPALERLLPEAGGAEVLDFAVTHEPRATFRVAPGTRRLRPGPRTKVPGLFLAGAWTDTGWPATMEGAVRSGLAAAHAALAGKRRTAPAEAIA
ncbi:MAG TPA: hydroxysqualene dehydroxylase HpnE [Gaiellaceae bacterium]|nr:hydroxysqualene dehydroxylase HpnE [Gaiellaceae bacterium]